MVTLPAAGSGCVAKPPSQNTSRRSRGVVDASASV
jgi:hypothetical protein